MGEAQLSQPITLTRIVELRHQILSIVEKLFAVRSLNLLFERFIVKHGWNRRQALSLNVVADYRLKVLALSCKKPPSDLSASAWRSLDI